MPESLAVIRIDTTRQNRILKEIGDQSKRARGAVKVIQEYVRILTQSPGTDEDAPGQGTSLKEVVQQPVGGNENQLRIRIASSLRKALRDVRANQRGQSLPAGEKLADVIPRRIQFAPTEFKWEVQAEVRLESGAAFLADFTDIAKPPGSPLIGN